jgi:hypothetical protein
MSIYLPAGLAGETETPPTQEEQDRMGAFIAEVAAKGYLVAADGLMPSAKGVRIRQSNGEVKVTDGPFTESKELVAGFGIYDVPSIEVAIEITRQFMEIAGDGLCEIRQMYGEPAFAAE